MLVLRLHDNTDESAAGRGETPEVDRADDRLDDSWVYDFDTRLPVPCRYDGEQRFSAEDFCLCCLGRKNYFRFFVVRVVLLHGHAG